MPLVDQPPPLVATAAARARPAAPMLNRMKPMLLVPVVAVTTGIGVTTTVVTSTTPFTVWLTGFNGDDLRQRVRVSPLALATPALAVLSCNFPLGHHFHIPGMWRELQQLSHYVPNLEVTYTFAALMSLLNQANVDAVHYQVSPSACQSTRHHSSAHR